MSDAPGKPFDSKRAAAAASATWHRDREKQLREHGLWEKWGAVPPRDEREAPLEEYLPGGEHYEEPEP